MIQLTTSLSLEECTERLDNNMVLGAFGFPPWMSWRPNMRSTRRPPFLTGEIRKDNTFWLREVGRFGGTISPRFEGKLISDDKGTHIQGNVRFLPELIYFGLIVLFIFGMIMSAIIEAGTEAGWAADNILLAVVPFFVLFFLAKDIWTQWKYYQIRLVKLLEELLKAQECE